MRPVRAVRHVCVWAALMLALPGCQGLPSALAPDPITVPTPPADAVVRERAAPDTAPPVAALDSAGGAAGTQGTDTAGQAAAPEGPVRVAAAAPPWPIGPGGAVLQGGDGARAAAEPGSVAEGAPDASSPALAESGAVTMADGSPGRGTEALLEGPTLRRVAAYPGQVDGPALDSRSALEQGLSLLRAGQPDRAHAAFMRALRLGRHPAAALTGAGLAAEARGLLTRARDYLEAASRRAPESMVVQNNLGVVLFRLGEYGAAHRAFRRAFALSSGRNRAARRNLDRAADAVAGTMPASDPRVTHRLSRAGADRYLLEAQTTPPDRFRPLTSADTALDTGPAMGETGTVSRSSAEDVMAP